MKDKHLDYIIAFSRKNGQYPPYIHRHLVGGSTTSQFVGFWKDFGKGFTSVFQTIGNFVKDHQDIFIKVAVATALSIVFPELAPEIALSTGQDLLGQVIASAPANAPIPTQADIDQALAAYQADPKFNVMMKGVTDFITNVTDFTHQQSTAGATLYSPEYSLNVRGTNLAPVGDAGLSNMTLVLKGGPPDANGNTTLGTEITFSSPIVIEIVDFQNYIMKISCPANGAVLNADGSNFASLLNPAYDDSEYQAEKTAEDDAANAAADKAAADKAAADRVQSGVSGLKSLQSANKGLYGGKRKNKYINYI